ncbi:MAG: tyrosine-type recombinase/integrase, partial [Isosphaeraceae bacterium]
MRSIPKYRHHRASGLACVTLYGKDIYLGKYGTPESKSEYLAKITEWQANDGEAPVEDATIGQLAERYLKHAARHYRKRGRPTPTLGLVKTVCHALVDMYAAKPASRFGIDQYKAIRHRWATGHDGKPGVSRKTANQYADRLREVFRWGVEEGLVPAGVLHAIKAVKPLEKGRSDARETAPIRPVPDDQINAVRPFLHRRVVAKIDLQLLTGMRPGEVCSIRTIDLDRSGAVWIYTPAQHKTEHHGKARPVPIGPRGQAILSPFLDDADPERPILVRVHSGRQFFEGLP